MGQEGFPGQVEGWGGLARGVGGTWWWHLPPDLIPGGELGSLIGAA